MCLKVLNMLPCTVFVFVCQTLAKSAQIRSPLGRLWLCLPLTGDGLALADSAELTVPPGNNEHPSSFHEEAK